MDKLLVTVVGAIMMTALGLSLLLCSFSLLRRIEFDAICHNYVMQMDQAGGLTGTAAGELVQTLQQRHFYAVAVQAPQQASYGDVMSFSVQAALICWQLTPALAMEETEAWFSYEAQIVCRVMKNFSADP